MMSRKVYRTSIPYAFLVGAIILTILDWTFDFAPFNTAKSLMTQWGTLIGGFLMVLAVATLLRHYTQKIMRMETKTMEFWYAITLWGGFLVFFLSSLLLPDGRNNPLYIYLFDNIISPFNLAQYRGIMMAYTVLAAYYALKMSSLETTVFMSSGIIWLMRQIPLGVYLVPQVAQIGDWISTVPNTAGARGAGVAIAIGGLIMGMRVLVGKEPGLVEEDVS